MRLGQMSSMDRRPVKQAYSLHTPTSPPIFTALHFLYATRCWRSSSRPSVCLSICPSVKRVNCDKLQSTFKKSNTADGDVSESQDLRFGLFDFAEIRYVGVHYGIYRFVEVADLFSLQAGALWGSHGATSGGLEM